MSLLSHASGTRRCLQKHISKGVHIPQSVVDQRKADEIRLKIELVELEGTIITENNLVLSPMLRSVIKPIGPLPPVAN
uniref:Uncharacterized protein n=1 Tax=Brassica oleracea TaxID=3712 RepID=A0A3P6GU22_BRAOL|nr:unnamed protein product [Brassica oleracea]